MKKKIPVDRNFTHLMTLDFNRRLPSFHDQITRGLVVFALGIAGSIMICAASCYAQQPEIRINEKGDRIIVYPDGSWQPFTMFEEEGVPAKTGATGNSSAQKTYPIFDGSITPSETEVAVTEADLAKIAERKAQISASAADIAEKRLEQVAKQRARLEATLNQEGNRSEEELRRLKAELATAKKLEFEAKWEAGQAKIAAQKSNEFAQSGNFLEAFQASQELKRLNKEAGHVRLTAGGTSLRFPLGENYFGALSKLNPKNRSLEAPCEIAFEGKDEQTGKWRKDVHKAELFSHTNEQFRVYLKDKVYLRCEGFLTAISGGFRYLTLQFSSAFPGAQEAYGSLEKGSILTIRLLNGQFINLKSSVEDRGRFDPQKQLLTYRVHYPIDAGQLNILKKSEVDKVLVFWSSGYEEYEIYQVDFFMNQIACLEK